MKPYRPIVFFLLTMICIVSPVGAATYTIDSARGSDSKTSGTATLPFKTLGYAWPYIKSGDTVYLKGGANGAVNTYTLPTPSPGWFCNSGSYPPPNLFSSWTYFIGDSAATVHIANQLDLGANGGQYSGYSSYMNWTGVTFCDGIYSYGASNFIATHCKIVRLDPILGAGPNGEIYDDKAAVFCKGGSNWTLDHCEITYSGNGLSWGASNSTVSNNIIHDVTQDGIEWSGCSNVLYQGNDTFNCDDGLNDTSVNPSTGAAYTFHRHDDCMQFQMSNEGVAYENSFITIRGNRFRQAQGQDIQFNNHTSSSPYHNHDILIENNLFGATSGVTPIINDGNSTDNLIIRNNTVLLKQVNVTWNSTLLPLLIAKYGLNYTPAPRVFGHYQIALTSSYTEFGLQVYNNLLAEGAVNGNVVRADHNIIQFRPGEVQDVSPLAPGEFRTTVPQFANAANDDGVLAAGSMAVNAGTRLTVDGNALVSDIPATDYYGTPRDNRPDCGAYEVPRLNPVAEVPVPLTNNTNPVQWVDNFVSGNLSIDPRLATQIAVGIGWTGALYLQNYSDGAGNQLTEPFATTPVSILMNNIPNLTNFSIAFEAIASSGAQGGGPCFLYADPQDFFWVSLGVTSASLHRVVGGVDSQIMALPGLQTGAGIRRSYVVTVKQTAASTFISVAMNGGIPQQISLPALNLPPATTLSIGIYRNSPMHYQRLSYKNFIVTNLGAAPSAPSGLHVVP